MSDETKATTDEQQSQSCFDDPAGQQVLWLRLLNRSWSFPWGGRLF